MSIKLILLIVVLSFLLVAGIVTCIMLIRDSKIKKKLIQEAIEDSKYRIEN